MATNEHSVINEDRLTCCSVPKQVKCCVDLCDSPDGHIHGGFRPDSEWVYRCLGELTPLLDEQANPDAFMKIYPAKVGNNNADNGASFSDAYCNVEFYPDAYPIAQIFQKGLGVLLEYFTDNRKPADEMAAHSLEVLLHFLEKNHFTQQGYSLENIKGMSETDITIFLVNHFFGKLSITSKYVIDGRLQSKGKRKENACSCSKEGCKMTGVFGDTSIGNPEVWHGKVDVLLNYTDTVLKVNHEEQEDDHDDSPGKTATEVKRRTSSVSDNEEIFAEVIVFSFLQKQLHPYRKHHLYPCIAVNSKDLFVYLYDSGHDVLLASSPVSLFDPDMGRFRLATIFLSWLVVNHKCFSNGLSSKLTSKNAGFFMCKKIDIFEEGLQCGHVVSPVKTARIYRRVRDRCEDVEDLNDKRIHLISCKKFKS
ncbi:uncharacterized protein LOC110449352 [Mizuhopecten yessoensis]|uniref:Uncharacterized protein n=1 Tax=Mizuhopecten yessoensis TaxID=6573 RepID=A0A210QRE6_MIZYE|nr:uncharacterized protein LOC110449352 [Mizuhopecten yessoensis]OWF51326.1 hypothetical protein KP79_PYT24678 [Mizuhopecten yessoensis]